MLESLDQAGLLGRLIPEWDAVRFKAQHNPVHRFTVDRHLIETAAQAAALTREVDAAGPAAGRRAAARHRQGRPAGRPFGRRRACIAERIANRMGSSYGDTATVTALVRHHLLLPDTATRRDLDDPVTIATVAEAVGGSAELLDLLHALTIADAAATGPRRLERLEGRPDRRAGPPHPALLAGRQPPSPPPLDERGAELAEAGVLAVEIDGDEVIVAVPDALGVLYRAAGVLALHSLDVRAASIRTHAGMAVNAFVVEPRFGELPDAGAGAQRPGPGHGRHAAAGRAARGEGARLRARTRGRRAARPACTGSTTRRPTRPCSRSGPRTRSACSAGSPRRWSGRAGRPFGSGVLAGRVGGRRVLSDDRDGEPIPAATGPGSRAHWWASSRLMICGMSARIAGTR